MPPERIQHALGLHLYQPPGNLLRLLSEAPAELYRILECYARIADHARKYAGVARLHVAFSSSLLEQLRDPKLIEACRPQRDVPAILEAFREAAEIEFVGSGYRHAPLPLIPHADWAEQLLTERGVVEEVLGRSLKGYLAPAGCFAHEMIPDLLKAGYEYVLLPAAELALADGAAADPYRAYRLCHEAECIAAVPIDDGFSRAQQQGLEAPWFADAVRDGVAQAPASPAPYLLTTWSDGENGDWFRADDVQAGFFGRFFSPYMEFCETGEFPLRPVRLSAYLRRHRPAARALQKGGLPPGLQEPPAPLQEELQRVLTRLSELSQRYWTLLRAPSAAVASPPPRLEAARHLILQAEDSHYLLGDAARLTEAEALLDEAERRLAEKPPKRTAVDTPVPRQPAPVQAKDSNNPPGDAARLKEAEAPLDEAERRTAEKPPKRTAVDASAPRQPAPVQAAEQAKDSNNPPGDAAGLTEAEALLVGTEPPLAEKPPKRTAMDTPAPRQPAPAAETQPEPQRAPEPEPEPTKPAISGKPPNRKAAKNPRSSRGKGQPRKKRRKTP